MSNVRNANIRLVKEYMDVYQLDLEDVDMGHRRRLKDCTDDELEELIAIATRTEENGDVQ